MAVSKIFSSLKTSFTFALSAARRSIQSRGFSHTPFSKPLFANAARYVQSSVVRKIGCAIPIALSILMVCSTTAVAASTVEKSPKVVKIKSLSEISTVQPKGTIFLFDLDDTLIDSPFMLGSGEWRRYVTKEAGSEWHDFLSLFVAKTLKATTVEPGADQLVKDLQKEYAVCGLTSRQRNVWYSTSVEGIDLLTLQQLESANIHFDSEAFKNMYPELAKDSEYFEGVFFADTELKGEYLRKILEKAKESPTFKMPPKIIFIDDKPKQGSSVDASLSEIEHECYHYTAIDEKASKFNPLIANIQLYHLWMSKGREIVSDEQTLVIAQKHPEKDANYYLQAVLEIAKKTNPLNRF